MAENKQKEGKVNQTLVLKTVRFNPGISRIQVARELGLNRSTITHIVNQLLGRGLLRERPADGGASPAGGRRPIGLEVNAAAGGVLGVEWQSDRLRYILQDAAGGVLTEKSLSLRLDSPAALAEELSRIVRREGEAVGIPVRGIGIGLPGRVDPHRGRVLRSLPLNLTDFPLAGETAARLGLPVLVENDANCFAWGEVQRSKGACREMLCLMLEFHPRGEDDFADQEIGMGLVQGGRVYYGSRYSSGELPGPLVDAARSREFLDLIRRRDSLAPVGLAREEQRIIREYLGHLFSALRPIISILDPRKVILGGRFFQVLPYLGDVLAGFEEFPPWERSTRPEWEVAYGGAGHFTESLFTLPPYDGEERDTGIFWDRVFPAPPEKEFAKE